MSNEVEPLEAVSDVKKKINAWEQVAAMMAAPIVYTGAQIPISARVAVLSLLYQGDKTVEVSLSNSQKEMKEVQKWRDERYQLDHSDRMWDASRKVVDFSLGRVAIISPS